MKHLTFSYIFIIVTLLVFNVNMVSAQMGFDNPTLPKLTAPESKDYVIAGANYSINVNDTEHLQGRDTTTLYNYFKDLFENVFLNLSGTNANQDIDIGIYDFTTDGKISIKGTDLPEESYFDIVKTTTGNNKIESGVIATLSTSGDDNTLVAGDFQVSSTAGGTGGSYSAIDQYVRLYNPEDQGYGSYISLSTYGFGIINDPTREQIALLLTNSMAGSDVNMNRWSLYNLEENPNSSKVFLGKDNVKTYWGNSYTTQIWDNGTTTIINPNNIMYVNGTIAGNGSLLTDISLTETDPIFLAENNSLARTGDCPAGQVVQNTTNGGVECIAVSGDGTGGWTNTSTTASNDLNISLPSIPSGRVLYTKADGTISSSQYFLFNDSTETSPRLSIGGEPSSEGTMLTLRPQIGTTYKTPLNIYPTSAFNIMVMNALKNGGAGSFVTAPNYISAPAQPPYSLLFYDGQTFMKLNAWGSPNNPSSVSPLFYSDFNYVGIGYSRYSSAGETVPQYLSVKNQQRGAGRVTISSDGINLTGSGTSFTTFFSPGDTIRVVGSADKIVDTITSDTFMNLTTPIDEVAWGRTVVSYAKINLDEPDAFVVKTNGNDTAKIGINKGSPVYELDVVGEGYFTGNVTTEEYMMATDFLTASEVFDINDKSSVEGYFDNINSWLNSDGSINYKSHPAYKQVSVKKLDLDNPIITKEIVEECDIDKEECKNVTKETINYPEIYILEDRLSVEDRIVALEGLVYNAREENTKLKKCIISSKDLAEMKICISK